MKKQTTIIIALLLVFLLTACAVQAPAPTEADVLFNATETSPAETEAPTEALTEAPTEAPTEPPLPEIIPVEISLENWENYFELRQTEQVYVSESCGVTNRVFGYGIFLKEEFLPLLAPGSDVSFELQYDVAWKRVLGDVTSDSYMIIGSVNEVHPKTQTASLSDFRGNPEIPEESDFFGQVAVEYAYDSEFGA